MDPPEGAFILFSAGTGQTALDRLSNNDPDPNSVFTRALLPRLRETGLAVHDLVRDVRSDVRALAASVNHEQFPAYYDQLSGSFSFNPGPAQTSGFTQVGSAAPAPQIDTCESARSDWTVLRETESETALRQFASTYASCPIYVAAAEDRLVALARSVPIPVAPSTEAVSVATSCEALWYARNLIFHQKGYCFQTSRAQSVFDTTACTTRNPVLSAAEKQEVDRFLALEAAQGC